MYGADISENFLIDTISFEDNSSKDFKIDISNKEQDAAIQLDKKVTYEYYYSKLIKSNKYIINIKITNSKDIILNFKSDNNILSQIKINLDKRLEYLNIQEIKKEDKIVVLANNKLELIDISDIKHPKILNAFLGKNVFKTFVLDQNRNRIYLLSGYGETLYLIEGIDKNKFNIVKKYEVNNIYESIENIALSPSGNRLALLYSNGKIEIFNSKFQKEKMSFLFDYYMGLSFKNDNILFVNGYIIELNK